MKTTIKHIWNYSQSPEIIWEYLTKPKLIEMWLMANDFKLIIGHEFTFTTNPIPPLRLDGTFYCKVLEMDENRKLVYSWKGGPSREEVELDTIVEWILKPKGDGTELHLSHSGFSKSNELIFAGMYEGWEKNIQKMMNHIK